MGCSSEVRIRYGECDMQRVVFNPNYWVYCDDAVDRWIRRALAVETGSREQDLDFASLNFDFMVKSCTGTWNSPVRYGDKLVLTSWPSRWGNTSFDVRVDMCVESQVAFEATLVYVSVDPVSHLPIAIPDVVKRALEIDLHL